MEPVYLILSECNNRLLKDAEFFCEGTNKNTSIQAIKSLDGASWERLEQPIKLQPFIQDDRIRLSAKTKGIFNNTLDHKTTFNFRILTEKETNKIIKELMIKEI